MSRTELSPNLVSRRFKNHWRIVLACCVALAAYPWRAIGLQAQEVTPWKRSGTVETTRQPGVAATPGSNATPPSDTPADSAQFLSILQQRSSTDKAQATSPVSPPRILPSVGPTPRPLPQHPSDQAVTHSSANLTGTSHNRPPSSPAATPLPRQSPAKTTPLVLAGPAATPPVAKSSSGWVTMLLSLGLVIGLFLICMQLLKRTLPAAGQKLGSDVVGLLGQVPWQGRQSLQVIRFGNKLLLVAVSPAGCDTLTEITDPLEIDRLAGLCEQRRKDSSSRVFGELLAQWGTGRAGKDADLDDAAPQSSATQSYPPQPSASPGVLATSGIQPNSGGTAGRAAGGTSPLGPGSFADSQLESARNKLGMATRLLS
ncbi:MAG: flagellar biosynthetic protein FliO [Pirellulales bacterium]|nr:flagellar biosynthetic protein FliO [Pirellulales bacterium]